MADRNGYFQCCVKNDGTYINTFAPQGNGEPLRVGEVTDYLSLNGIAFDLVSVNHAVNEAIGESVKISHERALPIREMMVLSFGDNDMTCTARFYAPFEGSEKVDYNEIYGDLKYNNVVYGIDDNAIRSFLNDRKYCTDYVFARGHQMVAGTDASIEYLFRTELDSRPTVNEDGSVDFFHLDNICHCKVGDVLARMTPVVNGEDGINVFGKLEHPKPPRRVLLPCGKNMHKSEDGLELISDINGHVTLINDKVFVSGVLEVQNVDLSTGNIEYEGNVFVQGNVTSGFKIKATGNVEVRGVVEGAEIEAGGQIIIGRGITGMSRAVLRAGSNVLSRFIENATVHSGGYVETDCIIHSTVTAVTRIVCQGKRGFITGGVVRAGQFIEAKTLGSDMGVDTQLEVGTDPAMKERYATLQANTISYQKEIKRLEPVIKAAGEKLGRGEKLSLDQMKQLKLMSNMLSDFKEKLKEDTTELTKLEIQFDVRSDAYVIVTGKAFPGTRISISETVMVLKTPYQYCKFVRDGADVIMKPIV